MTIANLLDHLEKTTPSSIIKPGLERVQLAAQVLNLLDWGDTQLVTVAGSNGKGSTCAFLQQIAQHHGLSTGLYTSPHVSCYSERIKINGKNVTEKLLLHSANKILQYQAQTKDKLTYFELTTLIGFDIFQQQQLDLVILEVGLGGKYDAVNIAPNHGAIITSISYEHEEWLGNSLDEIGVQKAGIIKPRSKVVLGQHLPNSCLEIAQQTQSTCLEFAKQFSYVDDFVSDDWFFKLHQVGEDRHAIQSLQALPEKIKLPAPTLIGDWQKHNATLAITMFILLKYHIDNHQLMSALINTQLTGRFNIFRFKNLSGWLDVGHNPESAQVIADHLAKNHQQIDAIYASLSDKNSSKIINTLTPCVKHWTFIELSGKRAKSIAQLKQELQENSSINMDNIDSYVATAFNSTQTRLKSALERLNSQATSNLPILIFGSFELVKTALKIVDT